MIAIHFSIRSVGLPVTLHKYRTRFHFVNTTSHKVPASLPKRMNHKKLRQMETQDDVPRLKKLMVRSDVQSHHVRGQSPMYQLTEFTEFRRHTYA